MKTFAKIVLSALLAFSLTACAGGKDKQRALGDNAGGNKQIVIKFSHVVAPESVKGKAATKFAELVAQKTNGQVKVEVYPSSQLYGDNDELDGLIAGNVQMIAPSVTKMVKLDPRWQYVDMPFLFHDNAHVNKFFNSDVAKSLLNSDKLANNDIMGLTFWPNGFKQFTDSKKPFRAPADFSGLKFRVQDGQVLEAQFKALNAGTAIMAFDETYAALQHGSVDGEENTFNNIDTQKYQDVQKYLTVSNHGRLDYAIFVNRSFWTGMPQDIRTKVEEALKESTDLAVTMAEDENQKSFDNLKKSGKMQITELTAEQRRAFEQAMKPVYDQFANTITPEIINGIRNLK